MTQSSAEQPARSSNETRWRIRRATTCLVFLVVCVLQEPGRLVGDTKADLTIDPIRFLGRAVQMWDPAGSGGQVQNQAYGYLFPMGPFFAFFRFLDVPEWLTQRLWWTVLLAVAFLGAHKLFEVLGLGTSWSRYVGALAYALAPRVLGVMGAASVEAYPAALTPWVLVPLVLVASGQSRGLARAAALSALAIGLMGGVNAAVNLAAVLPAVLWFLTRKWDRSVAVLAGWWTLFVAMATLWWVVPLFLLGRYSPNFLDYIESAGDTTKVTNLIETVRGTSHWVGFLSNGLGSTWQIGGDLVTNGAFIANTIVVAAAGLVGIALLRTAERPWVVSCLLVGVAMVTFGHLNVVEGWFAESQNAALDGVLAPLRNVHKFDVLIRLALSIGIVSLLSLLDIRKAWAQRNLAVVIWPLVVAAAVVGVASPALIGRLAPTGSYAAVPDYWSQTGDWLDQHDDGRALLAPGARFGRYLWGTTNDEILQALTSADWEVRNAIPLTPPGHIRMLDAIERRFAYGQPSSGLADYLRRNGIGYVVVRHDLSGSEAHARTGFVEQVLSQSPGFRVVKRIGPVINPHSVTTTFNDGNLSPPRHAIEIWQVGGAAPDRVTLTPTSSTSVVSGDAQALLDLADAGSLPAGATVMSGDLTADGPSPLGMAILSDSYRRREVNYGRIGNNESSTLTPFDPLTQARRVPDYTPYPVQRRGGVGEWVGARSVVATSSMSDADETQAIRTDRSVRAMFDDDPATYWSAQPDTTGTTETVVVKPDRTSLIGRVSVQLRPDGGGQVSGMRVRVDGSDRSIEATQDPLDPDRWTMDVGASSSQQLELDISQKQGSFTPIQVTDLDIGGMQISYRVALADDLPGGPDAVVATASAGHNDGCVAVEGESVRCSSSIVRSGEDDTAIASGFALERGGPFTLEARAALRPGAAGDRFRPAPSPVTAAVSSSAVDRPVANGLALLDDDLGTTWVAGADDAAPAVDITLDRRRTVSKLRFRYDEDMPASRPGSVLVRIGDQEFRRLVGPEGYIEIPATRASSIRLEFTGDERSASFDPTTGTTDLISIGISELRIDGVPANPLAGPEPVDIACGAGPAVRIDGTTFETSVSATTTAVQAGEPVQVTACDGPVTLAPGDHDVELVSDGVWRPVQVSLTRVSADPAASSSRSVEPTTWSDDRRTVDVPARSEDAFLAVGENVNSGWTASLDGKDLEAVTIDGWKQGFVVPAGSAATVTMIFGPAAMFGPAVLGGLVLLAALAVVAVVVGRRRDGTSVVIRASASPVILSVLLVGALGLIGGTAGATAGVIAVATAQVARQRGDDRALLGGLGVLGVAFGAAGIMLVLRPAGGAQGYFGEDPLSQLLVLTALAMACAPWPVQRWNRWSGTSSTR